MYSKLTSLRAEFKRALDQFYDEREIDNIFFLVIEQKLGIDKLSYHAKVREITTAEKETIEAQLAQLKTGAPVQYILGVTEFSGLKFRVDEHVLIPRPETEELVEWVQNDLGPESSTTIWDIGTGSGCIAVSLGARLPNSQVFGTDLSESALDLASENAKLNKVSERVTFGIHDVLNEDSPKLEGVSVIISNPPYIPYHEKETMDDHVTKYEPDLALFVQNDDPLIFYKRISEIAIEVLPLSGKLYFELHEDLVQETRSVFDPRSWKVHLRQDLQGKDRMLRAEKIS